MAYYFPEGTRIYYSSTFASDKTVSAVTNASPAACTSTSHGYSDDGIVLFTSGWEDATDTLFKVDQTDANTFSLLGLNSLNGGLDLANQMIPVAEAAPALPDQTQ